MATPLQFDRTFKPNNIAAGDAAIEYNGFKFPTALRCNAVVTPVYDDANRVVKYNQLTLKVAFYLFHGLNLGADGTAASPSTGSNLYSGAYNYQNNIPTGTDETSSSTDGVRDHNFSTDQEMEYLKARLLEPGQHLRVTAQGIGTVEVQDIENPASADVDNGPKPSIATWRPLSNRMCFIEWSITARYSPCAADYPSEIAQFPFTVTFAINRRGLTTRTITGSLESVASRTPGDGAHAGATYIGENYTEGFAFSNQRYEINSTFPMLTGFHRDQKFTISADRKRIDFTIVDDEIDSDEAYGEGCAFEDVTLSTSNDTPKVFNKWSVTLSGSIELLAGYPKSYALAEVSRLFTRYFTVCGALSSGLKHQNTVAQERSEGQENDGITSDAGSKVVEASDLNHYLEAVSFKDHIFGRKISFSISWSLITTIQTLFQATGMFVPARYYPVDAFGVPIAGPPVDDPGQAQRDQWLLWKTSTGIFLDNGGFQALDFTNEDDVIVSLCIPKSGGGQEVPELNIQYDPDIDEDGVEAVTKENSWSDLDVRFELQRTENGVHHAPLGDYTAPAETVRAPNPADSEGAQNNSTFTPRYPAVPDTDQNTLVHNQRQPDYVLHFSGYATRLNYPVPEFNVQKYGGQTVIPIGTSTLKPRFIGNGVNLVTGESYKIYGLMWHKMYALPAPPVGSKIITDAHKDIFT